MEAIKTYDLGKFQVMQGIVEFKVHDSIIKKFPSYIEYQCSHPEIQNQSKIKPICELFEQGWRIPLIREFKIVLDLCDLGVTDFSNNIDEESPKYLVHIEEKMYGSGYYWYHRKTGKWHLVTGPAGELRFHLKLIK